MPWSRTIQSQVRKYSTFLRMPFPLVLFCPTRMGYSACPWTAACKALRACFWGQLATLWGPPQRKQRRGLEFVVEAPELFDEDDSFLWTGFTRQAGSVACLSGWDPHSFHLLLEGRGSKAEGIALDPTTALLAFRSERKRPWLYLFSSDSCVP